MAQIRKKKEWSLARELRQNGKSIAEIVDRVRISRSTVRLWVRDIKLSDDQRRKLFSRQPPDQVSTRKGGDVMRLRCREIRQKSQETGRARTKNIDVEHAFACALFWGEGNKSRNQVCICNSDVALLKFFIDFLRREFGVSNQEITISIDCYLTNGLTAEEITRYWLDKLDLPNSSARNLICKSKYYIGKESAKHPYGICRIRVCNTNIVQQLYGSIKEYIGDESNRWLD